MPNKQAKNENQTPMDREAFILWCSRDSKPHIQVIAEWASVVKPDCRTKAQWEIWLRRNLRPARDIAAFHDDQVQAAFSKLQTAIKEGWLKRFTLETILKFLTSSEAL